MQAMFVKKKYTQRDAVGSILEFIMYNVVGAVAVLALIVVQLCANVVHKSESEGCIRVHHINENA